MTDGEQLYLMFTRAASGRGFKTLDWDSMTLMDQEIWDETAYLSKVTILGAPVPSGRADRNWRGVVEVYGRHVPGCPIGAPCTCGFAEIEKELAA